MADQRATKVRNDRLSVQRGGNTRSGVVQRASKTEGSRSVLRMISLGKLKRPGDLKVDGRIRHHGAKERWSNTIRLMIKAKLKVLGSRTTTTS